MKDMSIPDFAEKYNLNPSTVYRFRNRGTNCFIVVADRYFVKGEMADKLAALCRAAKPGNPYFKKRKK